MPHLKGKNRKTYKTAHGAAKAASKEGKEAIYLQNDLYTIEMPEHKMTKKEKEKY